MVLCACAAPAAPARGATLIEGAGAPAAAASAAAPRCSARGACASASGKRRLQTHAITGRHIRATLPDAGSSSLQRPAPARRARRRCGKAAVVVAGTQDRVRFSADIVTNAPLLEHPKVRFSQYLGDCQRVFRALYPDQKRSERIDDETWRIYMLPLSFFLLSVRPVVDMRIWLDERQPVEAVPGGGEPVRVLSMQAVRWELRGVEVAATDFRLGVKGALMSSGQPGARRLRGSMQVAVSLAIPPVLALIPRGSIEAVGSTLLTQLLQSMKETVNRRLLLDYNQYAQEMAQTVASSLPKVPRA